MRKVDGSVYLASLGILVAIAFLGFLYFVPSWSEAIPNNILIGIVIAIIVAVLFAVVMILKGLAEFLKW